MNTYQIPNLAKACRVLAWLAGERGAFSVSEVARRLEMPRTTALRVLRTLRAEGLLEETDGRYRSGAGLLRLGLLALQSVEINSLAEPILQNLARATDETAHLAVRTDVQMLILRVADSPHPIRVASRPGALVSIHCAATGKALLAAMPPEQVRQLLGGKRLERRTDRTITTLAALEAELEAIRRQGYAVDDEEYHPGVRCLAAAVYDARGEVVAALGITAATVRFAKRKIPAMAREVTRAAEALSRALGQHSAGRTA
jgi:IclR family acetate operon transcriptional repressor